MKNRTIKFRAWDIKENRWADNSEVCISLDGYINGNMDGIKEGPDYYIAQQFTGLLDKNDKEIYEGDIVQIYDSFREVFVNLVIKFGVYEDGEQYGTDNHYGFYAEGKEVFCKKYAGKTLHIYRKTVIDLVNYNKPEVIGNIFENPDLVKEKE